MVLVNPKIEDLYKVAEWRNTCIEGLRTPGVTTNEMQDRFFKKLQESDNMKYFSIYTQNGCIGLVGLTDIHQDNKNAEISLIIDPKHQGKGHGKEAVKQILEYAFDELELENVYGECYYCNPNIKFWIKIVYRYDADSCKIPNRKKWQGFYYNSLYFSISKEDFIQCRK